MPAPLTNIAPLTVPWAFRVHDDGPVFQWSFADGGTRLVETITFDMDNAISIVRDILGYCAKGAGNKLRRSLPMQHWAREDCWATSVTMTGLGFDGNGTGVHGEKVPKAVRVEATVVYEPLPYKVLADDAVQKEYERFINRESEPSVEFASYDTLPNYKLLYAEGPLVTKPVKSSRTGFEVKKWLLVWTWMNVCSKAVEDSSGLLPNIDPCVGRVNNAFWQGFASETLILGAPKIRRKLAAVGPTVIGNAATDSAFLLDISLPFCFFDKRHTTVPAAGDWWRVVFENSGGKTLYELADYNTIFNLL